MTTTTLLPELVASPPHPLPFATSLHIRSYLLRRDTGNVLIYGAPGGSALGDISRAYLNHSHEAAFLDAALTAPLFVHAADRDETEPQHHVRATFSERHTLTPGAKYAIKHTSNWARALVKDVQYRLDVNTLHRDASAASLSLNEIGRVTLRTTQPLLFDEYRRNRETGSFILVDEATNDTVAAGMIV